MKRRRVLLSLRGGLVLLALVALLPALALQLYDGAIQRRQLVADTTQEAWRAADSLAHVQERITDGARMLLSTLAVTPPVRRLDAGACTQLFRALLAQNPIYLNILVVNAAGDVVAAALPFQRINLADRKHIKAAIAGDTFSVGEYTVSRMAFEPIIPFAYPVHDETGNLVGLVLASIRLAAFDSLFDRLRLPEGSTLGIADHAGIRLHHRPHNPNNPPGRPVRAEGWEAFRRGGDSGVILLPGSDERKRYYAWSKARLAPQLPPYMVFVVGVPEEAVLAPAREALHHKMLVLSGVMALAMGLAWVVGEVGIARRLDRIADTAGRIGQGDWQARTRVPHGDSGIGKVAKTIDAMAELLAEHEAAREQALAALRQSQERLAHITLTMADWVWETDCDGRFTYVGEQVRRVLGYEPAALYGKAFFDNLPPEETDRLRDMVVRAKQRQHPIKDIEYWCLAKDGQRRCLQASAVPWHDAAGRFCGYRGLSKDVTDRVRSEQAIRDSLRDKEILLKEIHHRVKNNLQIISGLLYLQEEQLSDPEAVGAFRQSRHRIASMALVHEELYRSTDLSRVRLGKYVTDLLPRLFGDSGTGPAVATDLHLGQVCVPIEQAVPAGLILNELLTNAYKHAFLGREKGALGIVIAEADGLVTIEVRDDGPGLPLGTDIDHTATLGMQLVSNLARQLRGSVEAHNDGGAVITLRFPKNTA